MYQINRLTNKQGNLVCLFFSYIITISLDVFTFTQCSCIKCFPFVLLYRIHLFYIVHEGLIHDIVVETWMQNHIFQCRLDSLCKQRSWKSIYLHSFVRKSMTLVRMIITYTRILHVHTKHICSYKHVCIIGIFGRW